jgi:hypothetical protein
MEYSSRECYVLRIYRRTGDDPEQIAGLVEIIDRNERKPFKSFGDLKAILAADRQKNGGKMHRAEGKA